MTIFEKFCCLIHCSVKLINKIKKFLKIKSFWCSFLLSIENIFFWVLEVFICHLHTTLPVSEEDQNLKRFQDFGTATITLKAKFKEQNAQKLSLDKFFDWKNKPYSRCPKSERSGWKTEQNLLRISDIRISDAQILVGSIVRLYYKCLKSEQIRTFGWSSQSTKRPKSERFDSQTKMKSAEIQMFGFRMFTVLVLYLIYKANCFAFSFWTFETM